MIGIKLLGIWICELINNFQVSFVVEQNIISIKVSFNR